MQDVVTIATGKTATAQLAMFVCTEGVTVLL